MSLQYRRAQQAAVDGANLKGLAAIFSADGLSFQVDWASIESNATVKTYGRDPGPANVDMATHVGGNLSKGLAECMKKFLKDEHGHNFLKMAFDTVLLRVEITTGDVDVNVVAEGRTLVIVFQGKYDKTDMCSQCPSKTLEAKLEALLSNEDSPHGMP